MQRLKFISNPINKFINLETSSSIILFACSIIAIIWANSAIGDTYNEFWQSQFTIGFSQSDFYLTKPLILWINDGLMAIFFFVIGLEVKREILAGELTTFKKASLPLFAAFGGMAFPALIFIILNNGKVGVEGWGIPMATDIAFALGILKLLGNRVPLGMKIFLTAFAIVDDIGAVLIIAIFYSANIQWDLIGYALALFSFLIFLNYKEVYSKYIFFLFGFIIWVFFLKSGIHPTIAGVLMAFTIPIKRKANLTEYVKIVREELSTFKEDATPSKSILTQEQIDVIDSIESVTEDVSSPLQHLEHSLHGWVSYLIMPIFALANAGVVISLSGLEGVSHLALNIAAALVLGNVIGIVTMSYLGIKFKLADLPEGMNFKQLAGVSILGGLGFTMSLFIANLAYTDQSLIAGAKLGIIAGSIIAGTLGYSILRSVLKQVPN